MNAIQDISAFAEAMEAVLCEMEAKRERALAAREKKLPTWRWWAIWIFGDYLPDRVVRWLWWHGTSRVWG